MKFLSDAEKWDAGTPVLQSFGTRFQSDAEKWDAANLAYFPSPPTRNKQFDRRNRLFKIHVKRQNMSLNVLSAGLDRAIRLHSIFTLDPDLDF